MWLYDGLYLIQHAKSFVRGRDEKIKIDGFKCATTATTPEREEGTLQYRKTHQTVLLILCLY